MDATLIRLLRALPAVAAGFLLFAGPVSAHAELVSSTPAADAELGAPPDEVILVFSGELDPGESEFTVTDAAGTRVGGGEVDLEVAERNELRGAVAIDEPGTYTVAWSVAASDGHPAEGSYAFTVADDAAGSRIAPDTALPAPAPGTALRALGSGLVVAAFGLAMRRAPSRALRRPVLVVATGALLSGLVACVQDTGSDPEACAQAAVEVRLTLSADDLEPGAPSVCRDQQVTFLVTSEVDGVLHVHGYDSQIPAFEVSAGETTELTFTAETSGQFAIEFHAADDPQGVEVGVFTVHEP